MKLIKNYSTFFENKLNENIFKDFFKKALSSVVGYFQRNFGKNAWLYYSLYLVKNDQMPKDKSGDPVVEIICPDSYLSGMKNSHVPTEAEIMTDLQSKFTEKEDTEEEIADKELDPPITEKKGLLKTLLLIKAF